MEKLLRARKHLAQNSKKGFTLVELIVVIVIIAILVAALVPAVLGAIEQANRVADQADARTVMTATSVALLAPDGSIRTSAALQANVGVHATNNWVVEAMTMTEMMYQGMTFTVHIGADGMPIGVVWQASGRSSLTSIGAEASATGQTPIGPITPNPNP